MSLELVHFLVCLNYAWGFFHLKGFICFHLNLGERRNLSPKIKKNPNTKPQSGKRTRLSDQGQAKGERKSKLAPQSMTFLWSVPPSPSVSSFNPKRPPSQSNKKKTEQALKSRGSSIATRVLEATRPQQMNWVPDAHVFLSFFLPHPRKEREKERQRKDWYSKRHTPRNIPEVQHAFKDLMIHWILQFALRIAFRCVLHRRENQDIHC